MTPKELAEILYLRDPRQAVYTHVQVLLALKRLLKEASTKDKKEILRALGVTGNATKKLQQS